MGASELASKKDGGATQAAHDAPLKTLTSLKY